MPASVHTHLTADTVATVTVTDPDVSKSLWIINRSDDHDVFFRIDGQDPVLEADDSKVCPANWAAEVEHTPSSGEVEVRLISAGDPVVSVEFD